ncbi:MAG: hypothetical protein ABI479_01120 [Gallionella sp.]
MKARILASIIICGILTTTAVHAESAFSTRDLDVIYSGFNPSFTRNVDVSNYYKTTAKLQLSAANSSTCKWRAVSNDRYSINAAYLVENNVESNYLASRNVQLVC